MMAPEPTELRASTGGRVVSKLMPTSGAYDVALEPAGWDFRVTAPVLPGAIAVIGDPALYATAGDTRVADVVVVEDGIVVTLLGGGERVRVVGWSDRAISASAWSPARGSTDVAVTHDPLTGQWELGLDIASAGWTNVHLRPD